MKSSITAHFASSVVATFNTKTEARASAKQMSLRNTNEIFVIGRHIKHKLAQMNVVEHTAEYYCEGKVTTGVFL
jgi:hypothetical protein